MSELPLPSDHVVFPLQPSGVPVQFRTPSPQCHPTQDHLLSPVKVAQHFAERKHNEVQAFGYDKIIHLLKDFETRGVFQLLGSFGGPRTLRKGCRKGQPERQRKEKGHRKERGGQRRGQRFQP